MNTNDKIAFALDVPNAYQAFHFARMLQNHIKNLKIGPELFAADRSVLSLQKDFNIILDLKLHDIPETVARTIKVLGDQGVQHLTIHIQQAKTIELALQAAQEFGMLLLGVSVLSSMDSIDCADLNLIGSSTQRVNNLCQFAYQCGMRGFVCSPQEVKDLHTKFPHSYLLVPGIRMHTAMFKDEHKRTGSPGQAVKDGANMIVVGRPIRDATNPIAVVEEIITDIETSSS
jgi:orotidine-5'-phosphate decarboxylase